MSNGQFAVRALNGAGVLVQGSSLTNCYVGVQCGFTPPGYGGYISTNSFVNSGAGLLPPYTGTGNGFGVGSVHRQSLEVGDVSGGTGNYFSGLSTGVYLLTSVPPSGSGAYNTVLSNNNFSNIRGSTWVPSGAAIWARNLNPAVQSVLTVTGTPGSGATVISNCDKRILARSHHVRVNSVEVTDATWGFHFGEADGRSIDVRDCEMNDVFYGIEAIGSVGYVALLHNNNILGYNMDFANFPPFISNSHFPIGVIIDNAAVTTNPVNIEEQQVTIQGARHRHPGGQWRLEPLCSQEYRQLHLYRAYTRHHAGEPAVVGV